MEYHEQALAIFREIEDESGEGRSLWNMSLALDQLGNRTQAIECAKAVLKILEDIEDPRADSV
ncbi:MAG: tetratricopeptide repeat protein [Methanothrix sp.]|nr:tetratricopeptide repeat protein [Methanothrix sp.]